MGRITGEKGTCLLYTSFNQLTGANQHVGNFPGVTVDRKDGSITVSYTHLAGELTADQGKYLPEVIKEDITPVMGSVHLKDFSAEKFKMNLKGNRVHTIEIQPGGVVTKKSVDEIQVKNGEFVFDPGQDIVKVAVVERHQLTGNVAC